MSDTDFAALIEPVARALWGEPNAGLSTKISLRWGAQGSRAIFLDGPGNWKNFESGEQGGVIDLVMVETGADREGALEWLASEGFIAARDETQAPRQQQEAGAPGKEASASQTPPAASPEAREVAVKGYHYTDGDGNILYDVVRFHFQLPDGSFVLGKSGNPKKTFRQRRPDGKGGYIWGLGDVGHTIYRRQQVEIAVAEGKTILLPEGEKDVETLESWGLVASTNSGGAQNWKPEFAEFFRGADVVILGDDDEAGRKRVELIGMSLRGIAGRIRAVNSWGGPKDVTDWKEAGHTADELSALIVQLPEWRPAPPVSQFGAIGLHELHQPHLRHEFLIDGFLDRRCVGMMPGASGSGKTFLVIEMGMCVALNREFWGMAVKPGLVVYQAGEGKEGVTKRLDGWMLDHGIEPSPDIPFKMLVKKVNLFIDDKDTDALIAECRAWSEYLNQPMRMLVIDTLNKAMTGANENAGQDISRILARAERISETLDCAVLIPMHNGKNGEQRGHSALTGDVANVINVAQLGNPDNPLRDRNGRPIRTASLRKNKDGESGRPMRFVLRQVVNGIDDKGKPITTCVVDKPDGDEEMLVSEGRLSAPQAIFLQTLKDSIDIEGELAPPHVLSGGRQVVKYKLFEDRLRNRWPYTAAEHEIEKRHAEFRRAVGEAGKRLVAYGYVERHNDEKLIWWTGKSDRPKKKPVEPPKETPSPLMTKADQEVPF